MQAQEDTQEQSNGGSVFDSESPLALDDAGASPFAAEGHASSVEIPVTLDEGEQVPTSAEGIEYDSEFQQRVHVLQPVNGEMWELVLLATVRDEYLRLYAGHVKRAMSAGDDEAGDHATTKKPTPLDAMTVLFDRVFEDIEGFEDGEEKPANWRDIFGPQDKASISHFAIFTLTALEPEKSKAKKPSWKNALKPSVIRLRVPFDGREIQTSHTLRKADAKLYSEFIKLWGSSSFQGSDQHMGELAAWYDELHVEHTGYKSAVPIHHKSAALISHLTTQGRVLRKN